MEFIDITEQQLHDLIYGFGHGLTVGFIAYFSGLLVRFIVGLFKNT